VSAALARREKPSPQDELLEDLASLENLPLDFAYWAFPWGEPESELETMSLEEWQIKVLSDLQHGLIDLRTAYRIAMKSGHDVGKSALLCILILWAFSTRVNTRGRCTANTERQLRTVLWVELTKWFHLFIAKDLFNITATRLHSLDPRYVESWRIDAMPWSDENPTAFAGLHNYGGRLIIVMDEAAKIPDVIWEVVDGTMREANTQLLWLVACQPVFNTGRFYECFNKYSDLWHTYTIDSREVRLGNKEAIEEEIKARGGEEDDVVRVRIRGLFPSTSVHQFFPVNMISEAQARHPTSQPWEPLIMGVDVARRGGDDCVIQFRRGRDARTIPVHRWKPTSDTVATMETGNIIAQHIGQHNPDAVFIDATGYGAGVADFVRHLGHAAVSVNFGLTRVGSPGGVLVANKRTEMYVLLKEWLGSGGCIPTDMALETELLATMYKYREGTGELILTPKEDMRALGLASPDWADALALTFAFPVTGVRRASVAQSQNRIDYDPLGPSALTFGQPVNRVPENKDPLWPGAQWRTY
jgi:hypothetical protein